MATTRIALPRAMHILQIFLIQSQRMPVQSFMRLSTIALLAMTFVFVKLSTPAFADNENKVLPIQILVRSPTGIIATGISIGDLKENCEYGKGEYAFVYSSSTLLTFRCIAYDVDLKRSAGRSIALTSLGVKAAVDSSELLAAVVTYDDRDLSVEEKALYFASLANSTARDAASHASNLKSGELTIDDILRAEAWILDQGRESPAGFPVRRIAQACSTSQGAVSIFQPSFTKLVIRCRLPKPQGAVRTPISAVVLTPTAAAPNDLRRFLVAGIAHNDGATSSDVEIARTMSIISKMKIDDDTPSNIAPDEGEERDRGAARGEIGLGDFMDAEVVLRKRGKYVGLGFPVRRVAQFCRAGNGRYHLFQIDFTRMNIRCQLPDKAGRPPLVATYTFAVIKGKNPRCLLEDLKYAGQSESSDGRLTAMLAMRALTTLDDSYPIEHQ